MAYATLCATTFRTFESENSVLGAERSVRELENRRGRNKLSYSEALNPSMDLQTLPMFSWSAHCPKNRARLRVKDAASIHLVTAT